MIFWTDRGAQPKVEKASLSGDQRESIVSSNLKFPNGIEIDPRNQRIYWVDGETRRIESVDYHGRNKKTISLVPVLNPFGVTFIPPLLYYTGFSERKTLWRE